MSVSVRVDVGGGAAGVGGLMWMVKGIVILSGGAQPLFLFEGAPLFFGVGLIGMYSTFGADPDRRQSAQRRVLRCQVCRWAQSDINRDRGGRRLTRLHTY